MIVDDNKRFVVCFNLDYADHLQSLGFKRIKSFKHYASNLEFVIFEYCKDFDPYLEKGELKHGKQV